MLNKRKKKTSLHLKLDTPPDGTADGKAEAGTPGTLCWALCGTADGTTDGEAALLAPDEMWNNISIVQWCNTLFQFTSNNGEIQHKQYFYNSVIPFCKK